MSKMLSQRIAWRYLIAKKSHSAVNIISAVSVAGVAVATMAIVVVLSVFNGFNDLAESHLSKVDPTLTVLPSAGKVMADADSVAAVAMAQRGVAAAAATLSERALAVTPTAQLPVIFKGVPADYNRVVDLDAIMTDGAFVAPDSTSEGEPAQPAIGVAARLGLHPSPESRLQLYVPRRRGRINPANPAASFGGAELMTTGVFQVDQMEIDADHIYIPLATARRMLDYDGSEATAVEIALEPGIDAAAAGKALQAALGPGYVVLDRYRQQADAYRMIAVEKWVTFLMLTFILVIASFNIISTLSLMVIEKRDNMSTLISLGAAPRMVRNVFLWLGVFITLIGGCAGIVLGSALSLAQQWGGFVKLGADPTALSIDVYPVRLAWPDLAATAAVIAVVAFAAGAVTRLFTRASGYNTEK